MFVDKPSFSALNLPENTEISSDMSQADNPPPYSPGGARNFSEDLQRWQELVDKPSSPALNLPENTEISSDMLQADNPPPYSPTGAQNLSDLQRWQEELERKAKELEAWEAQLANASAAGNGKNWPPLPAKCCIVPCFYQDISVEIPEAYQRTVRIVYYLWISHAISLFLNVFGTLAVSLAFDNSFVNSIAVPILLFFLFSPLSYVCWFRPLYKAFRSGSSFNFKVFFFVFIFQFMISIVFYAVGLPKLGPWGMMNGVLIWSFSESKTYTVGFIVGGIIFFIGLLWTIHALIAFYMLVKILRMYKGTIATCAKAQEELISSAMRNQQVQKAATIAIS